MPVGRLVILRSYPRSMFVNVLNIVTIPALLGPLLGPVLGGIIVQYASWHWIFLINIPVGMAGLWATWKLMPDLKAVREQKFDWPGFFLFSSSAVLATMGLSSAGGITDKPRMVILTSAGGILQLLYWVLAFRSKAPIFSPALFRIRNFAIGIAGNIVCRLGGSCLPYLMPLFFQVVLGYSALQSGMSLIPLALSNLLAKTVAPRLLGKFGYRNIMVVNTFTIGALLASFHFVGPGTHELILLGMLALLGGANSIQFTCMNTLTLIDLPNADASSGNSLLSTIMQLSIAVSIAAASLLLDSFGGHSATSGKGCGNRLSYHFRHHRRHCRGQFLHLRPGGQRQGNHPQTEKSSLKRKIPAPVQEQEEESPVSREQHCANRARDSSRVIGFLSSPRAT